MSMKKNSIVLLLHLVACFNINAQVVDASQYVDLNTGDFKYSMPLVTIPGPNGSFPLNLNYRGGIRYDQEAGMVGLGWMMEAGAIHRQLVGFPDDWKAGVLDVINGEDEIVDDKIRKEAGFFNKLFNLRYTTTTINASSGEKKIYGPLYFSEAYKSVGDHRQDDDVLMDVITYDEDGQPIETLNHASISLPQYDKFHVSVPGVGGSFSAKILQYGLLSGSGGKGGFNKSDRCQDQYLQEYYYINKPGQQITRPREEIHFYYENELSSNQNISQNPIFKYDGSGNIFSAQNHEFNNVTNTGENYNSVTNRITRGNHIDYYTNQELANYSASQVSLMLYSGISSSDRQGDDFPDDGIGGFSVTDMNGMTYHFALPVYQFESIESTEHVSESKKFLHQRKLTPYAYKWLLTGITGPNYVDVDGDGYIESGDPGYWVKFNYGNYSDGYLWKFPVGFNKYLYGEDNNYKSYSAGRKQLYYLNSVETETHMAYLVYAQKNDDRGRTSIHTGWKNVEMEGNNCNEPGETWNMTRQYFWMKQNILAGAGNSTYNHKVLRLDDVLLYSKENLPNISPSSGTENKTTGQSLFRYSRSGQACVKEIGSYESLMLDNVVDNTDLSNVSNLNSALLQKVELEYASNRVYHQGIHKAEDAYYGKLLLRKVKYKGLQGEQLLPSVSFTYKGEGTSVPYAKDAWGYIGNTASNDQYLIDDLYTKQDGDYASLESIDNSSGTILNVEYENDLYESEAIPLGDHLIRIPINDIAYVGNNRFRLTLGKISNSNLWFNGNTSAGEANLGYRLDYTDGYEENSIFKVLNADDLNVTSIGNDNTIEIFVSPPNGFQTILRLVLATGEENYIERKRNIENELSTNYYYGGGIRVKSLEHQNTDGSNIYKTSIDYEGGKTSYMASKLNRTIPYAGEVPAPQVIYSKVTSSVESYHKAGDISYYGEPLGSVIYEFKNIPDDQPDNAHPIKIPGVIEIHNYSSNSEELSSNPETISVQHKQRRLTVASQTSNYGYVESIKQIGKERNLISEQQFTYNTGGRGDVTEAFSQLKVGVAIDFDSRNCDSKGSYTMAGFSTVKKSQSSVFLKSNITHYPNGTSDEVYYNDWDEITGIPTSVITTDKDKNVSTIESIPAYLKYPEMGSMAVVQNNTNQLSAVAQTRNYLTVNGNQKLVGASSTLFSNSWEYLTSINGKYIPYTESNHKKWRPKQSYIMEGSRLQDGTMAGSYVPNIDWDDYNNQSSTWTKENEVLHYSKDGQPIITRDILGNISSNKLNEEYNISLVAGYNANLGEIYYSGAEHVVNEMYEGDIKNGGNQYKNPNRAHTGNYSDRVFLGHEGFKINGNTKNSNGFGFEIDRTYKASVWVHEENAELAQLIVKTRAANDLGSQELVTIQSPSTIKVGRYYRLEIEFKPIGNIQSIDVMVRNYDRGAFENQLTCSSSANPEQTCSPIYFDDFRIQPVDTEIATEVIDYTTGRKLATLDNHNMATKYTYDALGRVLTVKTETIEGWKTVSRSQYNFKKSVN